MKIRLPETQTGLRKEHGGSVYRCLSSLFLSFSILPPSLEVNYGNYTAISSQNRLID